MNLPGAPRHTSSRDSSRSSSRSIRCITSLLISPRCAARPPRRAARRRARASAAGRRSSGPRCPSSSSILPARTLKRRWRNSYRPRTRSTVSSRVHSSGRELVEAVERGARRREPRAQLLGLLLGAVLAHAEAADQHRQREPLADHGHEDQRERDEEDQVAVRAAARRRRSRAAAPARRPATPRRACRTTPRPPAGARPTRRARCCGPAVDRPEHVGHREHPQRSARRSPWRTRARSSRSARRPRGPRARRAITGSCSPMRMNSVALRRNTRISQTAKPWRRVCGRGELGRAPAEVDAAGDGREHAGEPELVGGDEGGVGRQQRDRDLGGRVVEPLADLGDHEPHGQPDRDSARRRAEELEPGVERREVPPTAAATATR